MTAVTYESGLRARSKREKELKILRAAEKLFKEKGYEATTTKAVSERAKIATGTLFLYVRDKVDLLLWVYGQKIAATISKIARKKVRAALSQSPETWQAEAISYFEPFFALYANDVATARHFVKEQLFTNGGRGETERKEFLQLLSQYIERGKSAGVVHPHADSAAIASTLFCVYFLHVSVYLRTGGNYRPVLRQLGQHIQQIYQGVYPK